MKVITGRRTMLLWAVFSISIALLSVWAVSVQIANINTVRVEYSVKPTNEQPVLGYCPGDTMLIHTHLTTLQPNIILFSVVSWWSPDKSQTVVGDPNPVYAAYQDKVTIDRDTKVTIPVVAPGNYDYRRGIQVLGDGSVVVSIPVVIANCGQAVP